MKGVPVFCDEAAMYAEYANTDIDNIEKPLTFNLQEYFSRLAYSQWTCEEIVRGEKWEFLEKHIKKEI